MFAVKPAALLQQKKIAFDDDDIVNEESEFLAGLIKFEYDTFREVKDKKGERLDKTETEFLLKTHDPIDFAEGDRVKIREKWFTVQKVTETLDEKYNAFVALNPHAIERFRVKELLLK